MEIFQKINLKKELSKNELIKLIELKNKEEISLLFQTANNLRQKENGNACCVHGIIEFSNHCRKNCFYCGIRKNREIKRYRMTAEEIIRTAKNAVKNLGFKVIVLQSGEDAWYDREKLISIVKEIRKLNVLIFLSIGERDVKLYKMLFNAGARAVLLRFETSNKKVFQKLRPASLFEKRIKLIKQLKEIGYLTATGFITGLPEETENDVINNILLAKSLKTDMYSFGPFIPAKETPLESHKPHDKDTVLKTIALARIIDRNAKILVTTGLETLENLDKKNKDAKKQGLLAGANSLMISITPKQYKHKYIIYDNKAGNEKNTEQNIKETIELLYSLGRAPTDLGI